MDQRGHDQPDGAQKFGEAERLEQRGGKVVDPAAKSSSYFGLKKSGVATRLDGL
jgi:hypothetical protein